MESNEWSKVISSQGFFNSNQQIFYLCNFALTAKDKGFVLGVESNWNSFEICSIRFYKLQFD